MMAEDGIRVIDRAPEAVAFDEWLRSNEGYRCSDGRTDGEYLQNRLWFAFMAGYAANRQGKA